MLIILTANSDVTAKGEKNVPLAGIKSSSQTCYEDTAISIYHIILLYHCDERIHSKSVSEHSVKQNIWT